MSDNAILVIVALVLLLPIIDRLESRSRSRRKNPDK